GDRLIHARVTSGEDEIVLGTAKGLAIRFHEKNLRPMGRATYGVAGVKLTGGDRVVDMIVSEPGISVLSICEKGFGKRSRVEDYRLQTRGGKGVINVKTTQRNGRVVSMKAVTDDDEVMMITEGGMAVRSPVKDIRVMGRATQGVRVIDLKEGDAVVSVARVAKENGSGP
ncbi:MAG: DNA gyrase C-terminal beta-propeller domain-containing protein, partial [Planctomycetota bacterium]